MRSKFTKTTITILLALCMAVSMFAVNAFAEDTNSTSTNANSTSKIDTCERKVVEYTATQAAKYIAGDNTYPELEGYLFAGWYNSDTCSEADLMSGGTPSGEKAFALFVPEHVLSIQAQVSANLIDEEQDDDAKGSLRFVTSVDSLLYKEVGFEVYYEHANGTVRKATSASNKVYSKLYEMDSKNVWEKNPWDTFCNLSKYFKICTLKNFTMKTYMDTKFTVKPYWITLDDDKVYGVEATKTFSEGCLREEVWVSSDTNVAKDEPNYGSYSGPYASLNYAIEHVVDGGIVHVKDDFTYAADYAWTKHNKNVIITGDAKDETVETLDFSAMSDLCINDGVTFRSINLKFPAGGSNNRVFAEGHKLVIENTVGVTNTVQLLGGSKSGVVENTNLEVYAGTYSAIYAGSATKDVLGDTNVIVGEGVNPQIDYTDHGHSNLLFGAGWSGTIHGDTNITVKAGARFNYIYGGGDDAGSTVKGSTNIKFAGNSMSIYGGSRNGVCADTYVEITGGYAEQVFGGSEGASLTGDTNIQILGGEVVRRIYGGSYNEWELTWKSSNYVDGFASVTIGSQATVSQSIEGLFATSRSEENNADEQGVIILNNYKNNTYSSSVGKNELGSTIMKGKAYHYLVNATAGGTVSSAGNCIYIKPADENTTATVRLDSEAGAVVYYAEEAGYYALPELVNGTRNVYVTFGTDTVTDFTGYEAKIGLAYYAELENAIAAAEKMDNATIENLSSESLATISVADTENGTVTSSCKNCIAGETVTLTVTPNEGYNLAKLNVTKDGTAVNIGAVTFAGGTYSIETEEGNYIVEAEFAKSIFESHGDWDLTKQYNGVISTVKGSDTGYLSTEGKYSTFAFTVKEPTDASTSFGIGGQFYFDNDKFMIIKLKKTSSGYQIQSDSANQNCLYQQQVHYTLTSDEVAKIQSDGLKVEAVRSGTKVMLYLDGERVTNLDVTINGNKTQVDCLDLTTDYSGAATGITEDTEAKVKFKRWGSYSIEIPFELSQEQPEMGLIDIAQGENGTISTNLTNYVIGEEIVITTKADSGYAYDSLILDDKEIKLDWDGTYTFTSTDISYKVVGSFAEAIFKANTNYSLVNQLKGLIATSTTGGTGYLETTGNYTDISVTVKDCEEETKGFEFAIQFYFPLEGSNYKFVPFDLYRVSEGIYAIKSNSGNANCIYANGTKYYTLSETEVAKLKSNDGLTMRVVRAGNSLLLYLDGKRITTLYNGKDTVASFDLSDYISSETTSIIKIQKYKTPMGDDGYVEIPFEISKEKYELGTISIEDTENGTVTANVTNYVVGDEIVLTAAGADGYAYDSFTINGKEVTLDWDGTYTFTTTEPSYNIKASFAQTIFNDHGNWNLTNQNKGLLYPKGTGNTGYLATKEYAYNQLTLQVKAPENQEFGLGGQFYYDGNRYVSFRIAKVGTNYTIRSQSTNSIFGDNKDYYTLSKEEVDALLTDDGIEFTAVVTGKYLEFYLDGKKVENLKAWDKTGEKYVDSGSALDLTINGATIEDGMKWQVKIQRWNTANGTVAIPFELHKPTDEVSININNLTTDKGTISTDKQSYTIGEKVVLTVEGIENYYYDSLKVNGKEVMLDWDGTFSFTATETSYTIEGSFSETIFKTNNKNYSLVNQLKGVIATSTTGSTAYLETSGNYTDISVTVKDCEEETKGFEFAIQFYFPLEGNAYKFVPFDLYRESEGTYAIKSNSGNANCIYANGTKYYTLSETEVAKLKSDDGLTMRVMRDGNSLLLYLDGKRITTLYNGKATVASFDLSDHISSETKSIIKIQKYKTPMGDDGYVEIPFELKKEVTLSVSNNIQYGTVTTNKTTYLTGDTVTLKGKSKEGYA